MKKVFMLCFALLSLSMFAQIPTQTITKQLKLATVPLGIGTEDVLVRGINQIVKRVPITSFSGITDAPSDGQNYFRNNANWVVSSGNASLNLQQVITAGNQISTTTPFLPSIIIQDTSPSVSQSKTTISAYGMECSATGYSDKAALGRMGVSWTNASALYNLRLNGNAFTSPGVYNLFLPKSSGWLLHTNYQEFADNTAAIAGGLTFGDTYRTGDLLKIVHN
jgi:hypothetical protein